MNARPRRMTSESIPLFVNSDNYEYNNIILIHNFTKLFRHHYDARVLRERASYLKNIMMIRLSDEYGVANLVKIYIVRPRDSIQKCQFLKNEK